VDSEEEKEEIDDEAKVAMKSYFAFIWVPRVPYIPYFWKSIAVQYR
jgi:hypothetical protein